LYGRYIRLQISGDFWQCGQINVDGKGANSRQKAQNERGTKQ